MMVRKWKIGKSETLRSCELNDEGFDIIRVASDVFRASFGSIRPNLSQ